MKAKTEQRPSGRSTLRETRTVFTNGLFFKSPVLIGALGLYPVVAAGYNLRRAVDPAVFNYPSDRPGLLLPRWLDPQLAATWRCACRERRVLLAGSLVLEPVVPGVPAFVGDIRGVDHLQFDAAVPLQRLRAVPSGARCVGGRLRLHDRVFPGFMRVCLFAGIPSAWQCLEQQYRDLHCGR